MTRIELGDVMYMARDWVELYKLLDDSKAIFPYGSVSHDDLVRIYVGDGRNEASTSQIMTLLHWGRLPPLMLPPEPDRPLGAVDWGIFVEVISNTTDLGHEFKRISERLLRHPTDPTPVTVLSVFEDTVLSITSLRLLGWRQHLRNLLVRCGLYPKPHDLTSFFDRVVLLARSGSRARAAEHLVGLDGVISAEAGTIAPEFDELRTWLHLFPSSMYAARIATSRGEVTPWPRMGDDLFDDDCVLVAGPRDQVAEAVGRIGGTAC